VHIRSLKVVPGADGPAIEVITAKPITPKITILKEPPRLVIDFPHAYLTSLPRIDFRSDQIDGIRASQFQADPPVARVVVDLAKPVGYSWDAAGNRLMIRLRPVEQKIAPAPPAPALVPVGPGRSAAVLQAVSQPSHGSSLTAGGDTAIMNLPHGGEIRVCPGTTVSVNYSQNGRDMLLGMNTGALEAHDSLDTSADSVITPDFRILFAGPGEFDFAISSDSQGNACVRSLPGNTGSATVSELMGAGSYQVKPAEEVLFRGGQISQRSAAVPPNCGCPPPAARVLTASAPLPSSDTSEMNAPPAASSALPPSHPGQVHVEVDAPFVFRATDSVVAPPAPVREVATLSVRYWRSPAPLEVMVLPPRPQVVAEKPRHTGFLGKVRGFFAAIFR
jgi:hypothetical protein